MQTQCSAEQLEFSCAKRCWVVAAFDETILDRLVDDSYRLALARVVAILGTPDCTLSYMAGQALSKLPPIARYLGVSVEELIGEPASPAAKKRGPTPKIQQQLERIQRLPKAQQRFVMKVIDSVLAQQQSH